MQSMISCSQFMSQLSPLTATQHATRLRRTGIVGDHLERPSERMKNVRSGQPGNRLVKVTFGFCSLFGRKKRQSYRPTLSADALVSGPDLGVRRSRVSSGDYKRQQRVHSRASGIPASRRRGRIRFRQDHPRSRTDCTTSASLCRRLSTVPMQAETQRPRKTWRSGGRRWSRLTCGAFVNVDRSSRIERIALGSKKASASGLELAVESQPAKSSLLEAQASAPRSLTAQRVHRLSARLR